MGRYPRWPVAPVGRSSLSSVFSLGVSDNVVQRLEHTEEHTEGEDHDQKEAFALIHGYRTTQFLLGSG
jgi:hypothetical protein